MNDVDIVPIYEIGKKEPVYIKVSTYKIITERCQECNGIKETKTLEKTHIYYKGEKEDESS